MTASLVAGTTGEPLRSRRQRDRLTVIAHRGASADAPENTLAAVDLAADVGADVVEVDVRVSADGELVVMHDTSLRRTTDVMLRFPDRGPWNVADLTLAEIRSLDAGSWFDSRYAGDAVPTLREVLDTLRGRVGLLLDMKAPSLHAGVAADVVDVLECSGWLGASDPRLVVQSFDWDFLRTFGQLASRVPVGLLGGPPLRPALAEAATWAASMNRNHTRVTARFVDRVHAYGMLTWPYTVNDPHRMRELIDLGVDGIITNRPDVLLDVLVDLRPGV